MQKKTTIVLTVLAGALFAGMPGCSSVAPLVLPLPPSLPKITFPQPGDITLKEVEDELLHVAATEKPGPNCTLNTQPVRSLVCSFELRPRRSIVLPKGTTYSGHQAAFTWLLFTATSEKYRARLDLWVHCPGSREVAVTETTVTCLSDDPPTSL